MLDPYWPSYSSYDSSECGNEIDYTVVYPQASQYDGCLNYDNDGFDNMIVLPHQNSNESSFAASTIPLPPISTFFEHTRKPLTDSLSLLPTDELLAIGEQYQASYFSPNIKEPQAEFVCESCFKKLPNQRSLRSHNQIHHEVVNSPCDYEFCTYISTTRKDLRTHIRQHKLANLHERKRSLKHRLNIDLSYTIENKKELDAYLKTCDDEEVEVISQKQTDILLYRSNIPSMNLIIEYQINNKKWIFTYKCIGCDKIFHRDYNAKRHSERHSLREIFCPVCNRLVRGALALKTHITKYHQS